MMKKWLLILIFTFGWKLSVNDCFSQGFQGKIIGGFNATQLDGDQIWGYNKLGLVAGGATTFDFSKNTGLQLEIYYSLKGSASSKDQPYFTSSFDYIDIPLMFNYYLKKRWCIQGGFTTGYLLKGQLDNTGFGYVDITSSLKKIDICYSIGAEYAFSPRLAFNARFNYSAISIIKPDTPLNRIYNSGLFNNYISFTLRYSFMGQNNRIK